MRKKKKVSLNVYEDTFIEYKKVLLDLRTNTTADINRYMQSVVEKHRETVNNIPNGPGKED